MAPPDLSPPRGWLLSPELREGQSAPGHGQMPIWARAGLAHAGLWVGVAMQTSLCPAWGALNAEGKKTLGAGWGQVGW